MQITEPTPSGASQGIEAEIAGATGKPASSRCPVTKTLAEKAAQLCEVQTRLVDGCRLQIKENPFATMSAVVAMAASLGFLLRHFLGHR